MSGGTAEASFKTDRFSLASLRDADGSAVMIHALADKQRYEDAAAVQGMEGLFAFAQAFDAAPRFGVTTGISAFDRATRASIATSLVAAREYSNVSRPMPPLRPSEISATIAPSAPS